MNDIGRTGDCKGISEGRVVPHGCVRWARLLAGGTCLITAAAKVFSTRCEICHLALFGYRWSHEEVSTTGQLATPMLIRACPASRLALAGRGAASGYS